MRVRTVEDFEEAVKNFTAVDASKAEELLNEQSGHIIFVGRSTCPYCRKFINKLLPLSKDEDLEIHFLNTLETDDAQVAFRNKYDIQTVPTLMYSEDGEVSVRSDSNMSREEILAFVGK